MKKFMFIVVAAVALLFTTQALAGPYECQRACGQGCIEACYQNYCASPVFQCYSNDPQVIRNLDRCITACNQAAEVCQQNCLK